MQRGSRGRGAEVGVWGVWGCGVGDGLGGGVWGALTIVVKVTDYFIIFQQIALLQIKKNTQKTCTIALNN